MVSIYESQLIARNSSRSLSERLYQAWRTLSTAQHSMAPRCLDRRHFSLGGSSAKYTVNEPIALLRGQDNSKAKRKNWIFLMDSVLQPIGDKDSGAVRSQVLSA